MEFNSSHFDQFDQLINEKNDLVRDWQDAWDAEEVSRLFYNGQPTMTEEEAEAAGREEVTNHMIGYNNLIAKERRIYRIYSGPGNLVEIKIDTGNPTQDHLDSIEMSKAMSKAIRHSGRFSSIWRSLSGELQITGRSPLIYDSPKGWCPKFAPRLLLPEGTSTTSADIPYCFSPVEMTMRQLEGLKKASEKKGGLIDGEVVDKLIEVLKGQIAGNVKNESGSDPKGGFEKPVGATEPKYHSARKTTVNVWWYYEPETSDSGTTKINATLFTEAVAGPTQESSMDAAIIGHIPGLLETPESWLHLFALDSEIGGVKNFDTAKGYAQLTYNSDLDTEELFNSMIEGDKARALPRFQKEEGADENEILAWNANEDSMAPANIKEFRLSGTSQNLLTPIGMLMNNSANISGGSHSNVGRDQQLRVQSVQAGQLASEQDTLRMEDVYEMADALFTEIAYRFCHSKEDKSHRDYLDIAWFRDQMDMMGIDYKTLATRAFGRMKYMVVKARRVSGGGMREEEIAISRTLMDMRGTFPPEFRPQIVSRAVATITQDSDFAEMIAPVTQVTLESQKAVAENEFDTIYRRALLLAESGEGYPVNPTDIDQTHLASHITDLKALLTRELTGTWNQNDSVAFDIMHLHCQDHLQRILSDTAVNKEATPFQKELQQLATIKEGIANRAEQQQQQQQDPKGQAEAAAIARDQERKDAELRLKAIDLQGTQEQRDSRNNIAARNQALKEQLAVHKVGKDNREEDRKEREARADFIATI